MKRRNIEARLHELHAQCLEEAISGRQSVVGRFAAEKRLNSGSFFKAVRDELLDHERKCLQQMASFAVTVVTPTKAVPLVENFAHRLHEDLRNILSATLEGDCGSRPAFKIVAAEIQRTFKDLAALHRAPIIHNVRWIKTAHKRFLASAQGHYFDSCFGYPDCNDLYLSKCVNVATRRQFIALICGLIKLWEEFT